jgi:RNA ligase (TIGR02306 family)
VQSRVAHPNADRLDIITVNNYQVIVGKDSTLKENDLCIFIEPDSNLPEAPWVESYKPHLGKGNRVRAIKLRGEFSMGIALTFEQVPHLAGNVEGTDLTATLGVTKVETFSQDSLPNANQAGNFPSWLPKTDQVNWNKVSHGFLGKEVTISRKRDGSSITIIAELVKGEVQFQVCSRNNRLKIFQEKPVKGFWQRVTEQCNAWITGVKIVKEPDVFIDSKWVRGLQAVNAFQVLADYCKKNQINMALQGEIFGEGIQTLAHNPDCREKLTVEFFHTFAWTLKHDSLVRLTLSDCHDLRNTKILPTTPELFRGILTEDIIKRYDQGKLGYEGVVVESVETGKSFKIRNKEYDSKK